MDRLYAIAISAFASEAHAVLDLCSRLGPGFGRVVDLIADCKGRTILFGVGKSGLAGRKIAATMASLGIPAFFVHAGESQHGDIGCITAKDVVIIVSYGGESDEILAMLPVLQHIGAKLVAVTGKPDSTLGRSVDIALDIGADRGAGMVGWTHLSSIAASMAMGDALAVAAATARGLSHDTFARYHPGGSYGKELNSAAGQQKHGNVQHRAQGEG